MKYLIITILMISFPIFAKDGNIFKLADINGDKKISLQEFQAFYQKTNSSVKFSILDSDKNGFIEKKDLKKLFKENAKRDNIFDLN